MGNRVAASVAVRRLSRRRGIFLPRLRMLARVISMTRIQENPVVYDRAAMCGLRQRHGLRSSVSAARPVARLYVA